MIRMTKQVDYGTVLLTFFAREPEGAMLSARDLAQRSRLPLPTVTKILKLLARAGVLLSHRGVKGGYSLARHPQEISIEQIVTALEGPIALTQCGENAPGCEQAAVCPIRPGWQRIDLAVRGALTEVSLADLAATHDSVQPSRSETSGQGSSGGGSQGSLAGSSGHVAYSCAGERPSKV